MECVQGTILYFCFLKINDSSQIHKSFMSLELINQLNYYNYNFLMMEGGLIVTKTDLEREVKPRE